MFVCTHLAIYDLQMLQHHTIEEADEDRVSTQEEATEEDEKRREKRRKPTVKSVLGLWPLAVKFLEMCLGIFCVAMIIEPIRISTVGTKYTYQLLLIFATFGGLSIAIGIILLGRLFGDRLPYKTSALFSMIGSFLNLAAGCQILIDRIDFSRKYIFYPHDYMLDMMCISGVFAIVNMFVFALDTIFTVKLQNDL